MKKAALIAGVTVLLAPASVPAADNDLRVLAPSSVWALDFADERCSLIREFSDGEDTIRLQIDAYGPAPGYVVVMSGDLVPGSDSERIVEFGVAYSPDAGARGRMSTLAARLGEDNAVSFAPGFLPDAPWAGLKPAEFAADIQHLTVDFTRHATFRLETGSMAAPFSVMQQCVDDLIASWGLDPEQYRAQSRPPMLLDLPKGYRRVKVDLQDSHPEPTERRYRSVAEAQLMDRERPVPRAGFPRPVRVMVDASGQPTACVVQIASMSDAYRKAACEELKGPYQPALDAEGRPVASLVQTGINQTAVQLASN